MAEKMKKKDKPEEKPTPPPKAEDLMLTAEKRVEFFMLLSEEEREKQLRRDREFIRLYDDQQELEKNPEKKKEMLEAIEKEIGKLSEEERKLTEEKKRVEEKIKAGSVPELAELTAKRRQAVQEEVGKIKKENIENSDELNLMFDEAVRTGEKTKAEAIMLKLAGDGNFNELLHHRDFKSNWKGFQDFFDKVIIEELGLSEQVAYTIGNDISFKCERVNHYDQARSYIKDPVTGLYRKATEDEHVAACIAEIGKLDGRKVSRDFNRLAYGGEKQLADGTRIFKIEQLGIEIIGKFWDSMVGFIKKGEFNKNVLEKLYSVIGTLEKDKRIPREFVEALREGGKKLPKKEEGDYAAMLSDILWEEEEEEEQKEGAAAEEIEAEVRRLRGLKDSKIIRDQVEYEKEIEKIKNYFYGTKDKAKDAFYASWSLEDLKKLLKELKEI